jgi:hypothetical protein
VTIKFPVLISISVTYSTYYIRDLVVDAGDGLSFDFEEEFAYIT